MKSALSGIHLQERGVFVQASTLGSLEALLGFLKQSKIPVCYCLSIIQKVTFMCVYILYILSWQYAGVNIGPVHKKDVTKASVMLEHDSQ